MDRVKVALTVVSLTALALCLTSEYRRRRRRRGRKLSKSPRSSCYLQSDQKPQLSFKRVLADNSYSQFKHFKNPNSGNSSDSHPYESEINALLENPRLPEIELDDRRDLGMGDGYVWVETESQLNELAVALSGERVFAVDTEHHSVRSFLGFTALVQISTKTRDYLVDTIALHDVMGVLRPIFFDPNILKVFHGADNDVLWLQRDFHLYVVNLFDTAKACELLSKPYKSLAYLLETYCGVVTNKLLQREDWRQRPLSLEMLEYAKTDAHYLLHIAGCLISELKQISSGNSLENKINLLIEASRRSNMTCLQLYSKETEALPGESAASSIFSRHLNGQGKLSISCETQDQVRRLCAWRDLMARIHDESLRFVLSDESIVLLATEGPKTQTELYNIISQANLNGDSANSNGSSPSPSPVVCCHLDDLLLN